MFRHKLAEGELVRRFDRGPADAAEDRRAVAAYQRVGDRTGARGAPEVGSGSLLSLGGGIDSGHQF